MTSICRADTQVGVPVRLSSSDLEDISPVWNPANNTIAFLHSAVDYGSPYDIYQTNADQPGDSIMATGLLEGYGLGHSLSWVGSTGLLGVAERIQQNEYLFFNSVLAPFNRTIYDGNDAAFTLKLNMSLTSAGELFRVSRNGTTALWRWSNNFTKGIQQIRTAPVSSLTGQSANTAGTRCINETSQTQAWFLHGAALTPDGSKFVIPLPRSTVGEQLDTVSSPHDLWLYNSNGTGTPINLTHSRVNGINARFPDISPDGRKIIFSRWDGQSSTTWDLYIMNIDGTDLERVTNTNWFTEYEPSWSPDGTRVTFRGQHRSGQENLPPALLPGETSNANIYAVDVLPDCDNNHVPDLCEITCASQICTDRCNFLGCGDQTLLCFQQSDCDGNSNPDNCDLDSDGDHTPDACDGCINDPNKVLPGLCGCGISDIDSDGDSTLDCHDSCPSDPNKVLPGTCGCGVSDIDTDSDGTPDCIDQCPNDQHKLTPGICGCGVVDSDSDNDGTADCLDQCPNDRFKIQPGVCGCGISDADTDHDSTPDCLDQCPLDPLKTTPGICGCGQVEVDSDSDGTFDCVDQCPADPAKTIPGACGCGVIDFDSDGDSTADCIDNCPLDPNKSQPGACGCGVLETDSDSDGTPNCIDNCPQDPLKTAPGLCGCGTSDIDSDGDIIPNCQDACPFDPNKLQPGVCGCGVIETDTDGDHVPNCIDACPNDANKVALGRCGCGVSDLDSDQDTVPDCVDICPYGGNRETPLPEICDGIDNDCDGQIDEDAGCNDDGRDCTGTPGGSARRDHCGKCNGDGTSCLECRFIDTDDQLTQAAAQSSQQNKLIATLAKRLARGTKADKKLAKQTLSATKKLSEQNQVITATNLPRLIAICPDTTYCTSISHSADIALYTKNTISLDRTVTKLLTKLKKSWDALSIRKAKVKAGSARKSIIQILETLPRVHSKCI